MLTFLYVAGSITAMVMLLAWAMLHAANREDAQVLRDWHRSHDADR